jgi:hypothetical protein
MKIAICLTGTVRSKSCINELNEYLIKPNQPHEIHLIARVWDVTGDRVLLDNDPNIKYDIKTDRIENLYRGITRMTLTKGTFGNQLDDLNVRKDIQFINYMDFATNFEKKIPNIKWSKLHNKNYYFIHRCRMFLMKKCMEVIDDSYDIIFICRTDKINLIDRPIIFIDKFTYMYNDKIYNIKSGDDSKYAEIKHMCQMLNWNVPDSDKIITTFIRSSGTFCFEWVFGDYETINCFCKIYDDYDYICRILCMTPFPIGDETTKEMFCLANNIKIYGFEPCNYDYDKDNINEINKIQTFNLYNLLNNMYMPDDLF